MPRTGVAGAAPPFSGSRWAFEIKPQPVNVAVFHLQAIGALRPIVKV
jgi:hypothetical protein